MKVGVIVQVATFVAFSGLSCGGMEGLGSKRGVDFVRVQLCGGRVGAEIARRALASEQLSIIQLESLGMPFRLYEVNDQQFFYTVLEDDEGLVLLCEGFACERAENFKLEDGVWMYTYTLGSGMGHRLNGRYDPVSRIAAWNRLEDVGAEILFDTSDGGSDATDGAGGQLPGYLRVEDHPVLLGVDWAIGEEESHTESRISDEE